MGPPRVNARGRVEAPIQQPLHGPARFEAVDDLGNVLDLDVPVPDSVGVDDHRRPVCAGVEAARRVRANHSLEPAPAELRLERLSHGGASLGGAAATRVSLGADVLTHEDVVTEPTHASVLARPERGDTANAGSEAQRELW